jgi:hypothetical protein
METCNMDNCPSPKHVDSVRGYCERHHLAYQQTLRDEYFSLPAILAQRKAKADQGHW